MTLAIAPPTIAERERDLTIRAKAGDGEALADLLAMHDGFFRQAAFRCRVDPDDGAQEARIAAIEALAHYDPATGFRFLTYASKKVYWVLRRKREYGGTIRLPTYDNQTRTKGGVENATRARKIGSLDYPDPVTNRPLSARLPSDANTLRDVMSREDAERVHQALDSIPERYRMVLLRRLDGEKLKEIGGTMGVSSERIRQIEGKALKMLAEVLIRQSCPTSRSTATL